MAALVIGVWAAIALAAVSLIPAQWTPRVFHSNHAEHFAAFYVISFLGAAALPLVDLDKLILYVVIFAAVLAVLRLFTPYHRLNALEDFVFDVGGVMSAIVPVAIGRIRHLYRAQDRTRAGLSEETEP